MLLTKEHWLWACAETSENQCVSRRLAFAKSILVCTNTNVILGDQGARPNVGMGPGTTVHCTLLYEYFHLDESALNDR